VGEAARLLSLHSCESIKPEPEEHKDRWELVPFSDHKPTIDEARTALAHWGDCGDLFPAAPPKPFRRPVDNGDACEALRRVRVVRGNAVPPEECHNILWRRVDAGIATHPTALLAVEDDNLLSVFSWGKRSGWGKREEFLGKFQHGRLMHELSNEFVDQPACDGMLVYSSVEADHPTCVGMYQNGSYKHGSVRAIHCAGATYKLERVHHRESYRVEVSILRRVVASLPVIGRFTPPRVFRITDSLKKVESIGLFHDEMYVDTRALDALPNDVSKVRAATALVLPLVDPSLHGIIHDIKMEIIGTGCEVDPLAAVKQVAEWGRAVNRAKGPTLFSLK